MQQPSQRKLGRAATSFLRQRVVGRQQLEVGGIVVGGKARHGTANVLGIKTGNIQWATQKATRHRAERHKRNAQLATSGQYRNFRVACP